MTGIRRADHPLRFYVPSETRHGMEHLVDLAAYKGNGQCGCEHFTYRCQPLLSRGTPAHPLLRCNHIERARDHFITNFIDKVLPHLPKQDEGE